MRTKFIAWLFLIALAGAAWAGDQKPASWTESEIMNRYSKPALPEDRVMRMWKNEKGGLVLATAGGIASFLPENGRFRQEYTFEIKDLLDAVPVDGNLIAVLDTQGLKYFDPARKTLENTGLMPGQKHSYNLPILAPVSPTELLAASSDTTLWRIDLKNKKRDRVKLPVKAGAFAMSLNPADGYVYAMSNGSLQRWKDGAFEELGTVPVKECYNLSFSPDGKFIYFYNPLSAYEIATGKITSMKDSRELYRWGMAVDPKTNVLYCAGWESLNAYYPADNPAKWQLVNSIMVTDPVPVYTHRSLNPASCNGSLLYLSETDELLVACRLGLNVLGRKGAPDSFGIKNDYRNGKFDNRTAIPGKGKWSDFLRENKLSAMWVSSSFPIGREEMEIYRNSGINTLIFLCFQIEHGQFYPPHDVRTTLRKLSALCREYGMKLIPAITPYNISINNSDKEFRRMILPDGDAARHLRKPRNEKYVNLDFPCYLDGDYSRRAGIAHQIQEFAKLAQEGVIDGLCFELGDGFGGTNIRQHPLCFCDDCFKRFTKLEELPPAKERLRWLYSNRMYEQYQAFMETELAALCGEAAAEARKIAPDMELTVMLPEQTPAYQDGWFFNAFIGGFHAPDRPVTVFSEQTYGCPYLPQLVHEPVAAWKARGWDTVMIPGVGNYWLSPAQVLERGNEYARNSAGVYFYQGYRWNKERAGEVFQNPLNKFDKRRATLGEYYEAMSKFRP
jgi:hypothetical protein